MFKSLRGKILSMLFFFIVGIVGVFFYQVSLCQKQKGNFLIYAEYTGSLNNACIDLSVKINGVDAYKVDSIGWCDNKFSVDTVLWVPLGVNSIEISSSKLDLHYNGKITNVLYRWARIEIIEHYSFNYTDSLKEIRVRFGYGNLGLL